jgi:hypothetical protein
LDLLVSVLEFGFLAIISWMYFKYYFPFCFCRLSRPMSENTLLYFDNFKYNFIFWLLRFDREINFFVYHFICYFSRSFIDGAAFPTFEYWFYIFSRVLLFIFQNFDVKRFIVINFNFIFYMSQSFCIFLSDFLRLSFSKIKLI